MREYEDKVILREETIDGIGPWYWPEKDRGAWKGPKEDWLKSHRDLLLHFTKGRKVCVQAGGNCGMYPRLLAEHFDTVYTFEPDGLNFHCLTLNCQKDNILKFHAALGENHSLLVLDGSHDPANVGMHKVMPRPFGIIPQFCIDDLALRDCDLIQLDVEGYELSVLKGAARTVEKFKPTLMLERPNENIRDWLGERGYRQAEVSVMDTIFIAAQ